MSTPTVLSRVTLPLFRLPALAATVARIEGRQGRVEEKVRILAFNVSGGDQDGDQEEAASAVVEANAEPAEAPQAAAAKAEPAPRSEAKDRVSAKDHPAQDRVPPLRHAQSRGSVMISKLESAKTDKVLQAEKHSVEKRRRETESLGRLRAAATAQRTEARPRSTAIAGATLRRSAKRAVCWRAPSCTQCHR